MRVLALVCAGLAANAAFVAADKINWEKLAHELAQATKQTEEHAAAAVADGAEHAKEAIEELRQDVVALAKGPVKDAIQHVVEEAAEALKTSSEKVSDKVKDGADKVHAALAEAAKALSEALNKAADNSDGDSKPALPAGVESVSLDAKPDAAEAKAQKCMRPCPRIYMPVCGSDGRTHANKCEMERYGCEHSVDLTVVHMGKCDGPSKAPAVQTDPCWRACPDEEQPVCGSDGKTYANECQFKIEQCHMGGEGMLTIKKQGLCEAESFNPGKCMKACTRDYRPVCGSDGKTYSNKCMLEMAACMYELTDTSAPKLTIAYRGKCQPGGRPCPELCTMDYRPVCGTDGHTYGNLCGLRMEACKSPELELAVQHEGPCATDANNQGDDTKAEIIASASLVTAFFLAAALLVAAVTRRMRGSRAADMGRAPPPYSKLLQDDQEEADPDELFTGDDVSNVAPYTKAGYSAL